MLYSLVKTASDERGERRLAREARWLRSLEAVPSLDGQVPRLLEEGTDAAGRRYLVISAARGAAETRAFTAEHARFLASLGKARFRVADFEVSGCCESLQRSLRQLPERDPLLEEAFHECEAALLYWTGPYVMSQGEFAPWNIRRLGAQLFVSEWGDAHADASPLGDVLHYLMSQRPASVRLLRAAMRRAQEFARQAYPEWRWRAQVIGALTLVYLLGVVLHHGRMAPYLRLIETRAAWMPAHD